MGAFLGVEVGFALEFLVDPVLVAGVGAGGAQAGAGSALLALGDAGVLLLVGEFGTVFGGGGGEAFAVAALLAGARVPGFDPKVVALFAAPHIPNPVAATAASEGSVATLP